MLKHDEDYVPMAVDGFHPRRTFFDGEGAGDGGDAGTGADGGADPGGGGGSTGDGSDGPQLPEGAFLAEKFLDALPEDVRAEKSVQKLPSLEAMARSFVSAQKMIGKDVNSLVELPEEVTPDTRRPVLQRLGLPEEVKAYELKAPAGTPDGLAPNTEFSKAVVAKAHELGIFPDQLQGLYEFFTGNLVEAQKMSHEAIVAEDEKNIEALKSELGETYNRVIADGSRAAERLGIMELANETGLGANPKFIKAMARVGEMMREDGVGDDKGGSDDFGSSMTPAQLEARAKELQQQSIDEKNLAKRRQLQEEAQTMWARVHKARAK